MWKDTRGLGRLTRRAVGAVLLAFATSACTPLWGGGVLLGLVAVGALTSHCYDYLDVTVFDADGRKTCAATVTAINGGDHFELTSCYYAPLTDGHWTLRASLPGSPDVLTTVEVEHAHDCTRHVQTVELTLNRAGVAKPALPPPAVTSPPPAPAPAVPTASSPLAAQPAPAAQSAAPVSPPSSSAPPADSAAPSVGVFPERPESSH